MKIKMVFFIFLFFIANFAQGQVKFRVKKLNADSLVKLIPEKEGIEKIEALNLLSNVICRRNIDSSINLATQAIDLSEKLEYQKGLADGYHNVGNGYFLLDSLQPTISNYLKALRIYEDLEPTEEFGNLCMQLYLINLFTRRWSPIKSVSFIDPDGILYAWTTKVLINNAITTAITITSKFSLSLLIFTLTFTFIKN